MPERTTPTANPENEPTYANTPTSENPPSSKKRVRTRHFRTAKEQGRRITGLTSYDQLTAQIFDEAGIDFLLVGDSAGNNVLGFDTTLPVTLNELIPLVRAVTTATSRAFIIADMPFGSYEVSPDTAVQNAIRLMKKTGAHAVKLEGGQRSMAQIQRIVEVGIPVMAHLGFTPQSEHALGGHLIQGRGADATEQLLSDAHAVEKAGAFAVVLEMMSAETARQITKTLTIPTIGVGAGPHVDGQLLVWTDWAGLSTGRIPKFVRQYADLKGILSNAAQHYITDVTQGNFPAPENIYE